jgi:hypothetical protein
MAHGTKFDTRTIRDRKIDLYVDSRGKFNADWDGENIEAPNLDALVERLTKITKVNLSIKFCRWGDDKIKHGEITGRHGANNNILVRFEGEKGSQQEYSYSTDNARYLRLSLSEETEYIELQKTLAAITAKIEKFEESHAFSAQKAILKALGEPEEI